MLWGLGLATPATCLGTLLSQTSTPAFLPSTASVLLRPKKVPNPSSISEEGNRRRELMVTLHLFFLLSSCWFRTRMGSVVPQRGLSLVTCPGPGAVLLDAHSPLKLQKGHRSLMEPREGSIPMSHTQRHHAFLLALTVLVYACGPSIVVNGAPFECLLV